MNKKETAYVEELQAELQLAKAMRFTEKVKPDVMPPGHEIGADKLRVGFLFSAYAGGIGDNDRVVPACTSSIYHNFGSQDRTTTQGSRALYSTRLLALRGVRHEAEKQCAKRLASIDARIEKELEAEAYKSIVL